MVYVWLQNIDEVLTSTMNAKQRQHARITCQAALYTAALFTRGYGIANDTRQIRVVSKINNQPIGRPVRTVVDLKYSGDLSIKRS